MSIKSELLALVEEANRRWQLPGVREIYIPEPEPSPEKDAEFGMVVLEDGSAGLYYAWLGDSQKGMNERFSTENLSGLAALDLAEYYRSAAEDKCSLGLAAINAITRHVFMRCGYSPPAAGGSFGATDVSPGDHIGMVGYFPSLVKKLRGKQVQVTVIEKKSQYVSRDEQVRVTLEPSRLKACNKVLITAATMLNDTLDAVLEHTTHAQSITVLGPTAGFFPDPLFRRGVSALGGTEVTDTVTAIRRLRNHKAAGDAARKFLITRDGYPGFRHLPETV